MRPDFVEVFDICRDPVTDPEVIQFSLGIFASIVPTFLRCLLFLLQGPCLSSVNLIFIITCSASYRDSCRLESSIREKGKCTWALVTFGRSLNESGICKRYLIPTVAHAHSLQRLAITTLRTGSL